MKPSLQDLDKLPVEVIQLFRKNGQSSTIPEHLQKYIMQLDRVAEIRNVEMVHNVTATARRLMESFPDMSLTTAKLRIDDAINYFHLNSTVKAEAWNNYYADRLEDLAQYAMKSDNITEARRCIEKAHQYRIEAANNSINPEDFKPVIQLLSPDVDAKRLGFKEDFNLRVLWTDTQKFINALPIDERDKQRALDDAGVAIGIEDIDYEDI
jgi:hypothetical protein